MAAGTLQSSLTLTFCTIISQIAVKYLRTCIRCKESSAYYMQQRYRELFTRNSSPLACVSPSHKEAWSLALLLACTGNKSAVRFVVKVRAGRLETQ